MLSDFTRQVDVTDLAAATQDARLLGVKFVVLKFRGPGGGWPLAEISGPREQVVALLKSWGYDERGYAS